MMSNNMKQPKQKLLPVIYTTNSYRTKRGAQNTTQQIMLLKALQVTNDPKKLRDMIHARSVAEVYRTLDKMAMRKEYHDALARAGISFDTIAATLNDVMIDGEKDGDRVKAAQTLLKSLGMEKYDGEEASSSTWEEELLKTLEKEDKKNSAQALPAPGPIEYEVAVPEPPAEVAKQRREDANMVKSIYE